MNTTIEEKIKAFSEWIDGLSTRDIGDHEELLEDLMDLIEERLHE